MGYYRRRSTAEGQRRRMGYGMVQMIAYILLDVAKEIYIPHEYWINPTQVTLKAAGFYCTLVN